ncbi:hypothetical protein K435DRAFT_491695 [Dendrothele bispora CBS 962.96]|uniref:Uncharacterized protein n=1 Tax=Dendrothele bispora (strain CBS 962.96) TaxID=1314807 RepID=A0A4S8KXU6_DENBC|nr:hypothetical protein K435DRAFT_491695 [Dendrothele bispora CBS 962.96]
MGVGVGVGVVGGILAVKGNEVWSDIILIWTRRVDKEGGQGGWTRRVDKEGGQGGYAGGWSEEARRMSLAGRPGAQQGPSGGKPTPRDGPNPSSVLVHRDGGRVPEPQQPETPEGPEEIPPTCDSLVLDGDEWPRNGQGVVGGGGEGGASGSGRRRE